METHNPYNNTTNEHNLKINNLFLVPIFGVTTCCKLKF